MKTKLLLFVTTLLMTAMGVQADDAFVVWDETNTTLYFSYGAVPTEGDSWTPAGGSAITATKVWSGTDVTAKSEDPGWFSTSATMVVIEASFKSVKPTSCYAWFARQMDLTTIKGLTNLDTSNASNFFWMFDECKSLTSLDLSSFDTSKVTDMSNMFNGCTVLKTIIVGDKWSTASIGSGGGVFGECTSLIGEDGTKYDNENWNYDKAHTGAGGYLTKKTVTVAANTVGSDNWATYYKSNVNRQADANTTVYTAAVSGDKMTLTEISDKIIKAGQAVILKSSAASITLTSTIDDATGDFTGNVLEGVDVVTDRASGNTYYVLGKGSAGIIGFYKYERTLSANKAFYKVAAGSREYFTIEGFSTGIQEMEAVSGKKADVYYDLSGRRLAQPKKGVNIVNGKLVIIK